MYVCTCVHAGIRASMHVHMNVDRGQRTTSCVIVWVSSICLF